MRDDKKPTSQNTTSQNRITDLMRRIALFKGSGYEVEEHYDKTYGRYYTFAGKIYDIYGNEIGEIKNFFPDDLSGHIPHRRRGRYILIIISRSLR